MNDREKQLIAELGRIEYNLHRLRRHKENVHDELDEIEADK